MILKKFKIDIYPIDYYVAIASEKEDLSELTKLFNFYENTAGFDKLDSNPINLLYKDSLSASAGCYPIQKNGKEGVLLIIYYPEDMDHAVISHEAVHIADYYFEVLGIDSLNFSQCNEHYAYLVGWAAGRIANTLIEYNGSRKEE